MKLKKHRDLIEGRENELHKCCKCKQYKPLIRFHLRAKRLKSGDYILDVGYCDLCQSEVESKRKERLKEIR